LERVDQIVTTLIVHFDEIEYHLISELRLTKNRLLVAIAWLTNPRIGDALIELKNKNVDIEIIVDDNDINRNNQTLKNLTKNRVNLTFIKNLATSRTLMHNKFCVIDSKKVITGSYNWTINANSNDENIVIVTDSDTASFYSHEFRRINLSGKPTDKIFFDIKDTESIVNALIAEFKKLIKENLDTGQLTPGTIANYENENLKNKIRTLNEEITNNLKGKLGDIARYIDLIREYGIDFRTLASEDEKANSRLKFKREGLDNYDLTIDELFKKFKFKAIQVLVMKYSDMFKRNMTEDEIDRLVGVFQFLINEKSKLGTELRIVVG
jgi:hypothetical protein